jgi:hypothetical protein
MKDMRHLSTRDIQLLFVFAVALCCTIAFAGASIQNRGKKASPEQNCSFSVFFEEHRIMSLEELRAEARVALETRGHVLANESKCTVVINVAGAEAGCTVTFSTVANNRSFRVFFDPHGKVAKVSVLSQRGPE